ncbi:MAG: RecQ family ATP-dependent DNA helicase [Ignavibacteriales bacterium]|nr:RecQ family ATP-dependent DNA helicase [Ignavibacteriales bacterium]
MISIQQMDLEQNLEKLFGYSKFRPGQKEIIETILNRQNVLAILPTGAGKSICYQLPALISERFSIVVSPLIALMKDQVDSIKINPNPAAFINSAMSFKESEETLRNISFGKIKILYLAPEKLENRQFAERIKSLNPNFIFIDEAHCISEWGHNFRLGYTKIKEFTDYLGVKNISAFTATATPEVAKDIVEQLGLVEPKIFVCGFERDNISINIIKTKKKKENCLQILAEHGTPAIVYTSSRKRAEAISEFLLMNKIKSTYYHAGLLPEVRKKVQEDFISNKTSVICATNAFGMGIDKGDIRLVLHYNAPGSIENYYQEIGRAGRDGKPSHAYLLYDDSDMDIHKYFIRNSYPDKETIMGIYDSICDFGKVAVGNITSKEIPIDLDFIKITTQKQISRGIVYSALNSLEGGGYLKLISDLERKDSIQFLMDKNRLRNFVKQTENIFFKEIILYLLRNFSKEIFLKEVRVSVTEISKETNIIINELTESLTILDNFGIISFYQSLSKDSARMLSPRISSKDLKLNFKRINESFLNQHTKVEKMSQLIYTTDCRFKFILNYFGETNSDYHCGQCDNCTTRTRLPSNSIQYISELILRTLFESKDELAERNVISILRGSVKKEKYNSITTFGVCRNYEKHEILSVLFELIESKVITKGVRDLINLTEYGFEKIKQLGLHKVVKPKTGYEDNLELFNILRTIRQDISKKFMQTSNLICPDEVLSNIVKNKPKNREQFLALKGTNERMFTKIGSEVIEAVLANERIQNNNQKITPTKKIPSSIAETYNLIKGGYTLKDIASMQNLTEAVISMQVETILGFEPEVEIKNLIPAEIYTMINEKIKEGIIDLKELKNKLPAEVTYPMIRIVLAKTRALEFPSS